MQTSKPLTLKRNFSWTFVGNAVYAACQWGMLVVLAKLGSPEMVGTFTLGLAITAPIFMFSNLQLRHIQATDARQQYVFGDYFGLRLISTLLGLIVVMAIVLAAGYRWQVSLTILLVGLAKAFESISDVFYGLIQQHERMDRIAISLMIKGPLSLVMLGLGIYLTGNVVWGTVGLAISWGVVALGFDLRSGRSILAGLNAANTKTIDNRKNNAIAPRWDRKTLKEIIWLALPLGFVMLLISLNTNVPRYFIEQYLGERELGFFAALAYLMVSGSMVVNALGQSATPRLAKYYAAERGAAFRQLMFKLVVIGAGLGALAVLVAAVAGKQVLSIFYQPEYAQYSDLFVWLMIAAGFSYVSYFLGYGMTAARYFRIQMPLFTFTTLVSAATSFWLIPTMGLKGAAIALIAGAISEAVFSLGVVVHAIYKIER
ncbi:MAG: oligosaccharide flippase family protein [Cyanobacteria bacterium J06623_7]